MDEVIEQYRRERSTHVPLEVVGEHAQADVGANTIVLTVKDRPDMEVDGLVAAERRSMTESLARQRRRGGALDVKPRPAVSRLIH